MNLIGCTSVFLVIIIHNGKCLTKDYDESGSVANNQNKTCVGDLLKIDPLDKSIHKYGSWSSRALQK
jgi:hypothetical protein